MTRRPGTPDPGLERADEVTLSLSTVRLDAARLRQLLAFERALRAQASPGCASEALAAAHAAALAASGLQSGEVEAPLALLRRFAANRALSGRLREHLVKLEARGTIDGGAADQAADVRRRLGELDQAMRAREDSATLAVLQAHEPEILSLFTANSASTGAPLSR
ncbi:MAG TPA: hypothetical protein VEJ89_03525 [Myxococcaceae bacterium]|jgi:hypothetical protein|nr:hypothetical protein [Myxococcaceae bacterium]